MLVLYFIGVWILLEIRSIFLWVGKLKNFVVVWSVFFIIGDDILWFVICWVSKFWIRVMYLNKRDGNDISVVCFNEIE